ncbi:MAG: hypothetical protein ACRC7O_03135 [Fimbriiglobus sp.]
MSAFDPSLLPPVAVVEVRVVRRGGPTIAAEAGAAARIADLWRRLPPGEQARCHIPTYELRFLTGGEVVCSGTVCWDCNNIHGVFGGEPFAYEFDATAPASQALLAEVRRAARGSPAAEPSDAASAGLT